MRRPWFVVGLLLTWPLVVPLPAQHATDLPTQRVQQQKSAYYTQVEYQRCRSDIIELLVKAEPLEARIKELEAEVQKLTDALRAVKEGSSAPPTN
jgi:septal ring factor EnvC (AmiA/AmiB activator)